MTHDLYILNWKSSFDVMLLLCQSRQQHLSCAIFRPGICKNIVLCSALHWRITTIKWLFSGVHECVNGADALTYFT